MTNAAPGSPPPEGYAPGRKLLSVLAGSAFFLGLVPLAFLLLLGRLLPLDLPQGPQRAVACALLAAAGLAMDAWAVRAFIRQGRGTQMPFTPTTRLVTTGPYRLLRNPILLSVSLYYIAVAALPFGWSAGAMVGAVSLLCGGLYYHFSEEPQMLARFGAEYLAYRARTPFLLPWPRRPRDRKVSR